MDGVKGFAVFAVAFITGLTLFSLLVFAAFLSYPQLLFALDFIRSM